MKLLFIGPLWEGSTALQRLHGFERVDGMRVASVDSLERAERPLFVDRVRHKLRWPRDRHGLNARTMAAVESHRPEAVFIDSSRVLTRSTVQSIKRDCGARTLFYSPDDVSQPHNSSRQLESCDHEWDVFFTTKSFNVPELEARGVRRPVLVGKSFDPQIHRPMTREEVGDDYERFDVIFVGTHEPERERSLNRLVAAGVSVAVSGGSWERAALDPRIVLRPAGFALDYTRLLHTGKIALCFLRKINRDRVTQRSVELPAAGRPMVAERTEEHDELFADGSEYLGFSTDDEMVAHVRALLADDDRRLSLAHAGRRRCLASGYSTLDRARQMAGVIRTVVAQ